MRRVMLLLLGCVLCAFASFPALSENLPDVPGQRWLSDYDRSPSSVLARFNELGVHWSHQPDHHDSPAIEPVPRAVITGENTFRFAQSDGSALLPAEACAYTLHGETDADGKVNMLSIETSLTGTNVSQSYLKTTDQLLQLVLFSMFDELDEAASRDLTLAYVYDIRPFNNRSVDISLPDNARQFETVVLNRLVRFESSVSDGSQIALRVILLGFATHEQIQVSNENSTVNRKFAQANIECTELNECAQSLMLFVEAEPPDWDNILAIHEQLSESIDVINELLDMLKTNKKSEAYLSRMLVPFGDFQRQYQRLSSGIEAKEINQIEEQVSRMQDSANIMQMLISMLLG